MFDNIILNSDSYKYSQFNQYPEGTEFVYSYIESRGGMYDELVMLGTQAFIRQYLTKPVTMANIDEAEAIILAHGEPFNREGWEYIVKSLGGRLPVDIKAIEEGTIVRPGEVLLTIVNTDPKAYWLTSFLETALLRAIWYPTTVAANALKSRKIILAGLEKTGDPSSIDFKLHDFGARGVSSMESSGIGGFAHLSTGFMGTDNVTALLFAKRYYDADIAGFSIPAMEHSTVTSWGRASEVDSYRNMLKQYAKPDKLLAAVSDSYDIYEACKLWGTVLKDEVLASGATVVIRPDSGDPAIVVPECLRILERYYGSTKNAKGFRVLNNVRMLQGDGINHITIHRILFNMEIAGYSADNVAFGQGGALLQINNRDDAKFAMKCSAICVNGEWHDVYKQPVHAVDKTSKRGRFDDTRLVRRFLNGISFNETNLAKIRELSCIYEYK